MHNPALHQEPRYEPAKVIPLKEESSLIDWLKETNRLIPRETIEIGNDLVDDEEISELMDSDDSDFDDPMAEDDDEDVDD